MDWIRDLDSLEALYGSPPEAAMIKVAPHLTPSYRRWIEASRFCLVATVGAGGADCSPRGDDGPVVTALDPQTLAIPDWRGNNRIDTLRNIVTDGRIALAFLVPGSNTVIRVNGTARLTADPEMTQRFLQGGRHPRSVIVIRIAEVYSQCARALLRAGLWTRDDAAGLPSVGDILQEMTEGAFDGGTYDAQWAARARETMW